MDQNNLLAMEQRDQNEAVQRKIKSLRVRSWNSALLALIFAVIMCFFADHPISVVMGIILGIIIAAPFVLGNLDIVSVHTEENNRLKALVLRLVASGCATPTVSGTEIVEDDRGNHI